MIDGSQVCSGNPDERFSPLATSRKGVFMDSTGKIVLIGIIITNLLVFHCCFCIGMCATASVESHLLGSATIRHTECEVLTEKKRCQKYDKHRKSLNAMLARRQKEASTEVSRTDPSSHVNYTALNTPENIQRLHNLHSLYRNTNQRLTQLRARIAQATKENDIQVDEELHGDLPSHHDRLCCYCNSVVP